MATTTLAAEKFWADKAKFATAECQYYETLNKEYVKLMSEEREKLADKNCTDELLLGDEAGIANERAADVLPSSPRQYIVYSVKPPKRKSKSQLLQEAELRAAGMLDTPEEPSASPPFVKTASAKKNKKKSKAAAAAKRAAAAQSSSPAANTAVAVAAGVSTATGGSSSNGGGNGQSDLLSPEKILELSLKLNSNLSSPSPLNVKKNNAHVSNVKGTTSNIQCTLVSEIAKAREHIKNSLEKMDGIATLAASPVSGEVLDRIAAVEKDNADLKLLVENLKTLTLESQKRIAALEAQLNKTGAAPAAVAAAAVATKAEAEDDDGVDLFASESDDEESAEAARIREERLAAYAAKKSKKPVLIAKSSLVLDIKPWDDETDLKVMETEVRKITSDGLLWGASKFVPVAFGIQKISISCVVEDDKVSIDWLTEEIEKIEEYVQSVDVAAFNKI